MEFTLIQNSSVEWSESFWTSEENLHIRWCLASWWCSIMSLALFLSFFSPGWGGGIQSDLDAVVQNCVWNDDRQCWELPEMIVYRTRLPPTDQQRSTDLSTQFHNQNETPMELGEESGIGGDRLLQVDLSLLHVFAIFPASKLPLMKPHFLLCFKKLFPVERSDFIYFKLVSGCLIKGFFFTINLTPQFFGNSWVLNGVENFLLRRPCRELSIQTCHLL